MRICHAQLLPLLTRLEIRYCAKERKGWRPRRSPPWICFLVDAESMEIGIDPSKREKGMSAREEIMGLETSARMSARALPATASYLNFLRWVAPGGFRRLRSG